MSKSSKQHSRQKKQPSVQPLWVWLGLVAVILIVGIGLIIHNVTNNAPKTTAVSVDQATVANYPLAISPSEVAAKQTAGAFILDVRTQSEWDQGHISGAILIPLNTLPSRLNELPRDREIIVVCHSGARAAQGRDFLRSAGYARVTILSGGLANWSAQGYPTTNS
jgi:rhodanese-related sulfurtransferase